MPSVSTNTRFGCASPIAGKARRILIVEDEAMIALMIEETLSDLGYRIAGVAPRLARGLELARTAAIDVAVLDVNLNGETCYAIAQVLRDRGVPFVFASGYGEEAIAGEFAEVPVVAKPFDTVTLMTALASV